MKGLGYETTGNPMADTLALSLALALAPTRMETFLDYLSSDNVYVNFMRILRDQLSSG